MPWMPFFIDEPNWSFFFSSLGQDDAGAYAKILRPKDEKKKLTITPSNLRANGTTPS
jgi:hypothetical protein